ncbi:MAG TPA: helix-turn-helix transcriptional regulator [Anaerolineae bacterium]|nr:helix-turn-helix transcriptional regulator [Anaerolineae bacterium]
MASKPKRTKLRETTPQVHAASAPIEPFFQEQMRDPEFRRAYEELEPEFELVRQLIDLRIKRGVSQTELARRVGVKQPSIARLEGRGKTTDLNFLGRVAKALDARLEVRLVPREASGKSEGQKRME